MTEYQPYQGGAFQPVEHAAEPARPLRVPAWIATVAVGLSGLTILVSAAIAVVGYLATTSSTSDTVVDVVDPLARVMLIVPGIAFIVWLHRARTNLDDGDHQALRWARGWTIGAWFIPLANLVLPLLVVNEIDAVSEQRANEAEGRPDAPRERGIFIAWAILWTVYLIQDRLATAWAGGDSTTAIIGLAAISAVEVAAAVSAILLILRITANQDRIQHAKALGPNYPLTPIEAR